MESKRRDVRYALQCPAELTFARRTATLLAQDVSYRGVFLRTDSPPGLRQLVVVALQLPEGTRFTAHAMTVHVVEPASPSRTPGVGVQFYALDAKLRTVWDEFIRDAATRYPPALDQAVLKRMTDRPEPIRRQAPRVMTVLPVRVKTVIDLLELYTRDISGGGMFIETDRALEPGAEVSIEVYHPNTEGTLTLAAVVRHRQDNAETTGVGVEFVDRTAETRQRFLKFVRETMEPEDNGVLIDEDDPLLL